MNYIVAIDGPAGSGKGTIARSIAKLCRFLYLDTGIYYRSLAYLLLENKIDVTDSEKVIDIAKNMNIQYDGINCLINNQNINNKLRTPEVDDMASLISGIKEVRLIINEYIYNFVRNKNIVVDGRDTTSVLFPDAFLKVYLDASLEERAKRRFQQNKERNIKNPLNKVEELIDKRDNFDKNKEYGALKLVDDALYIDTTKKSLDEVVEIIINEIRNRGVVV